MHNEWLKLFASVGVSASAHESAHKYWFGDYRYILVTKEIHKYGIVTNEDRLYKQP